jgi:hypothetical protein
MRIEQLNAHPVVVVKTLRPDGSGGKYRLRSGFKTIERFCKSSKLRIYGNLGRGINPSAFLIYKSLVSISKSFLAAPLALILAAVES